MMDYGVAGAASAQTLNKQMPELGRLKAAAERVARAQNNVANFLIRFHGPMPEGSEATDQRSEGYRNDLDSLFAQIERLESVVSALDAIG